MLAVRARVYTPAYLLWSLAEDVCTGNDQVNMVYLQYAASTARAVADDELLSHLQSDPCTFTYTGDSHIRQDIFNIHMAAAIVDHQLNAPELSVNRVPNVR